MDENEGQIDAANATAEQLNAATKLQSIQRGRAERKRHKALLQSRQEQLEWYAKQQAANKQAREESKSSFRRFGSTKGIDAVNAAIQLSETSFQMSSLMASAANVVFPQTNMRTRASDLPTGAGLDAYPERMRFDPKASRYSQRRKMGSDLRVSP